MLHWKFAINNAQAYRVALRSVRRVREPCAELGLRVGFRLKTGFQSGLGIRVGNGFRIRLARRTGHNTKGLSESLEGLKQYSFASRKASAAMEVSQIKLLGFFGIFLLRMSFLPLCFGCDSRFRLQIISLVAIRYHFIRTQDLTKSCPLFSIPCCPRFGSRAFSSCSISNKCMVSAKNQEINTL
jgi:hypothetical protein